MHNGVPCLFVVAGSGMQCTAAQRPDCIKLPLTGVRSDIAASELAASVRVVSP